MATESVGGVSYTVEADTSKLVNSERDTSNWFRRFEDGAKKADNAAGSLNVQMRETAKAAKEASSNIQQTTASFNGLYKIAAAYLTLGTLKAMAELADQYGQNADRIKNATASMEEYNMVQERMLAVANGTYRSLAEAQEVYLATADSLRDLGYNTAQVLDITDSMSYAFVRDAARKDQATTAMDAYSKALMKGKVEADGWASIMAAIPSIVEGIAEATGKTTKEIKELGATGKLSLAALNEGFIASGEKNKEMADNMRVSTADAMQAMKNSLQVFIGKVDEASGASNTFAENVAKFSEILQDPATIQAAADFAEDIVKSLNWIIETGRDLYTEMKHTVRGIRALFGDIDNTDFENLKKRLGNFEKAKNGNFISKLFDGYTEEQLDQEIAKIKKQIDDGAREILEAQAKAADKLFTQEERVAEKRRALVNAEAPGKSKKGGGKSASEKEAERLEKQAASYLENLQRQAQEIKNLTAQERLHYDVLAGNVKLSGEQLELAKRYAQTIDSSANIEVFQKLGQALAEVNMDAKELAEYRAASSLNSFASESEVELVKQLAGALWEANRAKERQQQLAALDREQGANQRFAEDMLLLQQSLENKEILEQQYDQLRLQRITEFEEEKRRLAEETFRKQSEWNDMLMTGIDNLGSAAASSLSGILRGTTTLRGAMQSLAGSVLNTVIQSFVQMGVEYVKSLIIGKAAEKAFAVTSAATGTAVAEAWAPAASMVSLASFGANGVPAAAAITATTGLAQGLAASGGRLYGGPVQSNGLYRINENGAPEVFNAANGQQYMLPNTRGEVVSNKDATSQNGYASPKITVQLIEDSAKAGTVNSQQNDGETLIQAFVANIRNGGDAAQVLEGVYGMQRQGY